MLVISDNEGGTRDVPLLEATPENFIVPTGEEHLYHCRIEVRKFDAETGKRLSRPRLQVFGRKFFESFGLHNLRKQGYAVDVLHDPAAWQRAQKERQAETEKEKARQAAEAERKRIRQEVIRELEKSGRIAAAPVDKAKNEKTKKD